MLATVCVLPAIWEEIAFRGLILDRLREKNRSLLPGMPVHFLYNLAGIVKEISTGGG